MRWVLIALVAVEGAMVHAQALNYEGTLFDSTGSVITESGVKLKFIIRNESDSCTLFEIDKTFDLSQNNGHFSLNLALEPDSSGSGNLFADVMSNKSQTLNCKGGGNYSYTGNFENRRIQIVIGEINGSDIADIILPAQNLDSAVFAVEAERAKILSSDLSGDVSGAYNTTSVEKIRGFGVSETAPTNGQVLTFDGTNYSPTDVSATSVDWSAVTNIPSGFSDDIDADALGGLSCTNGEVAQVVAGAWSCQTLADNDTTYANATISVAGLMSTVDKSKLDNIADNAEVNVNADWNSSSGDTQILNKPSIPSNITDLVVGNDSISGDKVDGGIISSFASTGIDDNASTTSVTVNSSGNVGVGTSLPMTTLHLAGANPIIRLEDNVPLGDTWDIGLNIDPGGSGSESLDFLIWNQSGDTGLIIERGGNMGIGTKNPNDILHVAADGDTFITTELLGGGANTWHVGLENNSPDFRIRDGADDRIVISASGNVGVGTSNPTGALDVSSTSGALVPPRMTEVERDNLTSPLDGSVIYNTTSNKMNFRENGSWVEISSSGGGASCTSQAISFGSCSGTASATDHLRIQGISDPPGSCMYGGSATVQCVNGTWELGHFTCEYNDCS